MSIALALLAGVLSAPRLTPLFMEDLNERYPQWALHTEQSAGALVELVVQPNGRIQSCELLDSVGNARLAGEMCEETIGMRLDRATDASGQPVFGVIRTLLRLSIRGDDLFVVDNSGEPRDVEIPLAQLPDGYGAGFDMEVDLLVGADGAVEACDAGLDGTDPYFEPYVGIACERISDIQFEPLMSGGSAARFATRKRVHFAPVRG